MKYWAMKHKITSISLTIAGCLATATLPSLAQLPTSIQTSESQTPAIQTENSTVARAGFRCDTDGDVPTTIYQSTQGTPEPWIKWVSDHFSGSGWSPDERCQEVSSRLETYRKNKKLRYVTLGTVNNQSVICVASQDQGPCEGIIYTLKPGQDGIQALNNLFAWRKGEEGLQSNYESVTAIPYIDVGTRLNEVKAEPKTSKPATQVQPNTTTKTNTSEPVTPATHREL